MFEDIFETVIKGSNTIFLDINEKEYFLIYDTISRRAAEEIAKSYFIKKGKEGYPIVLEASHDPYLHTIKITIQVNCDRNLNSNQVKVHQYLNLNRNS